MIQGLVILIHGTVNAKGQLEMDENEKERLTKAEQTAGLLASDLKEILTRTDNLALEEIMVESIEQVEKIRRRLKRFAGN